MVGQDKTTVCLSSKVLVPYKYFSFLNDMLEKATQCVKRMLEDRTKSSSKYYKEIPSVLSKSLIAKYQRNKKCQKASRIVLPICGDKGKQIKITTNGVRIPALFKKDVIPCNVSLIDGHIRQVEFFKRKKKWYMSCSFNVFPQSTEETDCVGVDFNTRENVATIALPNGKVRRLGPDIGKLKQDYRSRRNNLQKKGKTGLLKKLSKKQLNRTKYINHKVSRDIVNLAKEHCSAIVLEDLNPKKGKIRQYTEKVQWSFYQLRMFIEYKAALLGIRVIAVNPAYTSKMCSRCGHINDVKGKHFSCLQCHHEDHRDANAAHNIRQRFQVIAERQRLSLAGYIGDPYKNWSFM